MCCLMFHHDVCLKTRFRRVLLYPNSLGHPHLLKCFFFVISGETPIAVDPSVLVIIFVYACMLACVIHVCVCLTLYFLYIYIYVRLQIHIHMCLSKNMVPQNKAIAGFRQSCIIHPWYSLILSHYVPTKWLIFVPHLRAIPVPLMRRRVPAAERLGLEI